MNRTLPALVTLLALGASTLAPARAADKTEVVALVASAATAAMNEIVPLYEKAHPGISVQPNYGGAQVLRAQVEAGSPADVLIVGDSTTKALGAKLGPASGVFVYREAVLVPKGSTKVHGLRDLANKGVRVALGTADSPHGGYARTVLAKAAAAYGADFPQRVMANVVTTKAAAAEIPRAVTSGIADAAIGFSSDASNALTAIPVPAAYDVVTETYATTIASAPHAEAAKDFVAFLGSSEAQAIFRKHHLDPPR